MQYGRDFLHNVEKLLKGCTEKREKTASQLHSLQLEQQQAVETLHILRAQRKEVTTEKTQLHSACTGNARPEGPAAQPERAGKSRAAPGEPSTVAAEQKKRAIRRAVSIRGSSQERGVGQKLSTEEDGFKRRSSFRSRKTADRPEWQN